MIFLFWFKGVTDCPIFLQSLTDGVKMSKTSLGEKLIVIVQGSTRAFQTRPHDLVVSESLPFFSVKGERKQTETEFREKRSTFWMTKIGTTFYRSA